MSAESAVTELDKGDRLLESGKIEEAIAAYRRAIELNPDDVQACHQLLEIKPDNWEVWLQLGKALSKQSDLEGAIACYRRAIEFNHSSEDNSENENRIAIDIEQSQLQLKQIDADIQELQVRRERVCLELDKLEYNSHVKQIGYYYTTDWFSHNIPNWRKYLNRFVNIPEVNVLEIGSWEGRSTCWLLDNILTHESAKISCVDTWQGGIEHQNMKGNVLLLCQSRFDVNVFLTGHSHKVTKKVGFSSDVMRLLPVNSYDFIYVDGSHEAEDVLVDAILAWGLLKVGGLVVFDDYGLGGGVKEGVDVFLRFFSPKLNLLHISFQVFVEKTA
ncbi:MAG: class I SAM-dependent methyltransferase [Microcoleus sp. PH2017_10_PVI_O_A]|uniref:class I SAM-dependent methyltransferase n=1 Tax=unclassified Microcoleus TaxID=2642155 RepID=UPI001DB51263|nr:MULTISPECIES: class I SAM-dependent methyltransferase [unclassified Microcoleus]TAE80540.1 MAG: tetratricopeptide repeat protein [Oscillatoriales cyanobacterium]MCC3405815.1 class I SAM-dependent methyltransferase [Microcoleus sp. PH2017_10_PVI_O_A]MCC3459879.1 class I SAM-dependent methyltransferase [Microcoleus sp. PH2017_11_PCY_U_A]MCC3478321.1 class I SAM-dependent methyltransferase [Microcoleus sp. PH2017_12_PCY_D_A]MCC3559246.1 class I SAM-dependent methyltransferase [Microcoleus sp. 